MSDSRSTPYAFRQYLPLTDNITIFQNLVANIDSRSDMPNNVDSPESGLDGIAQARYTQRLFNKIGETFNKTFAGLNHMLHRYRIFFV